MLRAANTARQSDEGITIQIYTLQPLNSIPGADPLLFSLDYASCGPHHVTSTPGFGTIPLFWLHLSTWGETVCVDNSGRQPYRFIWRSAGVFLGSKAPGGAL